MQTAFIIIGVVFAAFVILFFIMKARMSNVPLVADHEKIVTLTDKNFGHQVKNRVMLVDYWAAWCAPCRMMAPVLNEVAGELPETSRVGKVDIERFPSLAQKYNIRSIPTMILFRNGKEVSRYSGIRQKEFLLRQIVNS